MLLVLPLVSIAAWAQDPGGPNNSLFSLEELPPGRESPSLQATIATASPLKSIPVPLRLIKVHDIISIRIDELARMQSEGEVERRKNASVNAVLLDWLTLNGLRQLIPDPQANGDQRVQGQVDELFRAENGIETTERLTFNIAAQVVDVRPNGNIVLEARKEVRVNNEMWNAKLSGICRQEDIGVDNTVLSRNIVDLRIHKSELGHVRDGIKRGWLMRAYDALRPF